MTKALLNEDGELYAKIKIKIIYLNGRIIKGTRTGQSNSPNVKKNFNKMINSCVLDCAFQVKKEYNITTNSDEVIEFNVLDYNIVYDYTKTKKEIYSYKVKNYKVKGKNKKYIVTYRYNKKYKKNVYKDYSIEDINKNETLYHTDDRIQNKKKFGVLFKKYENPNRKSIQYLQNDK